MACVPRAAALPCDSVSRASKRRESTSPQVLRGPRYETGCGHRSFGSVQSPDATYHAVIEINCTMWASRKPE
eukprot:scaffold2744_cov64-Phaeocystis_antarctica.AAC.4